jgi:hypothetical protein
MTRFEIIYHADPHPSREGKRFTVNVNGRVFLTDSQRECVTELAHFLLDEWPEIPPLQPITTKVNMPDFANSLLAGPVGGRFE